MCTYIGKKGKRDSSLKNEGRASSVLVRINDNFSQSRRLVDDFPNSLISVLFTQLSYYGRYDSKHRI